MSELGGRSEAAALEVRERRQLRRAMGFNEIYRVVTGVEALVLSRSQPRPSVLARGQVEALGGIEQPLPHAGSLLDIQVLPKIYQFVLKYGPRTAW